MDRKGQERLRERLEQKRRDLTARLGRIYNNLQRRLDADSAERAKQLEDSDVVDALGREARLELLQIAVTLRRPDQHNYGVCATCRESIEDARLSAYSYATQCIECAGTDQGARACS